ncbi:MAG TPA: hypothetical protein VF054_01645 [Micromonosporaceae bacterium]
MDAYAEFIAEVQAGGFDPPAGDEWSAEQIAAHVACEQEALIATTESLIAGQPPELYDNREATDRAVLDQYASSYGGLAGLADRVAETVVALRELAAQLGDRCEVEVPVRVADGHEVVIDRPVAWGQLLRFDEETHVPRHLEQLRALRRQPAPSSG